MRVNQLHMSIIELLLLFFFFFNDTATTEIYTLSLHDALPIWNIFKCKGPFLVGCRGEGLPPCRGGQLRSEEHTSELQSQSNLVCRLLLEKKKNASTIAPSRKYTTHRDVTAARTCK